MATIDHGHLEFRGEDSDECEKFISGIQKYALVRGKQGDDAWIADFAATCMAKDAIRWWISLEENVQQSWKLLRKEIFSAYPPMFHGKRGEQAEEFVRMIDRRTRDARRQGDAKWINEFVQRCLAGEALRWYVTLESKVRDNWKLLRRAMLARWPTRNEKKIATLNSSVYTTHVPAAPPVPQSPTARRQLGRIRITRQYDSNVYYLSNQLNPHGFFTLLTDPSRALVVQPEPVSTSRWMLRITEGQNLTYPFLAIWWRGTAKDNYAALCACNPHVIEGIGSASIRSFRGSLLRDIWRPSNGGASGGVISRKLSAVGDTGDLFAYSSGSTDTVLFRMNRLRSSQLNLYFEPI